MHQLILPLAISLDPEAHELLRVFHTKGEISITVNTEAYDSKGVEEGQIWAVMLAQIANDIGRKLAQKYATPIDLEVSEIRKTFLAELENLSEADDEEVGP